MNSLETYLIDLIIAVTMAVSVYTDLRKRKIYNIVVIPAAVAGIILHSILAGPAGLLFSIKGLGAGLGLLFIPFIFGGFGAGDVKLLGAVGALKGTVFVVKTFLATGIAGGILAVVMLLKQKRLISTLKRLWFSLYVLAGSVFKVNTLKSLDKAEFHESLPYGLAICIGTVIAYLVG